MTHGSPEPDRARTSVPDPASKPTLSAGVGTVVSPLSEGPGARIGPYVLLQLLGEGGFGSVFLAEQKTPVERRVALKVIKLGMDTRQVIARFEAERQALALMEHPNIARVLDAGATEAGRPYFVMELVRGEPITAYCDRYKLGIPERLGLLSQVCGAVQHAHQKGVIHRDLKPSNVLVSSQDGSPVAKVIDFGVAKATNARLTERTIFTEQRQILGTPEYMSPEQAEGSLDIDTRTDVYALGVLLYELLTGQTPFDAQSLRSAAHAEIQRMIREVDPPRPSQRVSQSLGTLSRVAATRGLDPRRLGSAVRGDLDWIVMKAMDKDRTRRYDSASGLAMDVQRYLGGQAVLAAPPSAVYRMRKFVRRNKGLVSGAGGVAAALLVGAVGFAWQASVARGERDNAVLAQTAEAEQHRIADAQRDRAVKAEAQTATRARELAQVAEFQASQLTGLDAPLMGVRLRESLLGAVPEGARDGLATGLDSVNFTSIALSSLTTNVFDRALEAVRTQFADQPLVKARLLDSLAQTLQTLGLSDRALAPQTEALEIRRRELGQDHPDTLMSLGGMGEVLISLGRNDEAAACCHQALEARQRVLGPDHPDAIASMASTAFLLTRQGRYAEAEAMYREAVDLEAAARGRQTRQALSLINGVGFALVNQSRFAEAEPWWREAYESGKLVLGPADRDVVVWTNNLGGLIGRLGDPVRAEVFSHEAVEASGRLWGGEHPTTLTATQALAQSLRAQGRLVEAEALYRGVLATRRRVLGSGHPDTLLSLSALSDLLISSGKPHEAIGLGREALDARRRLLGGEHPLTIESIASVALILGRLGRAEESEALYREAVAASRRVNGVDHVRTLAFLNEFGAMLNNHERFAEAEPLLREALERRRRVSGAEHAQTLSVMGNLGRALHGQGRLDEAESLFREALDVCRRVLGPDHASTLSAMANLGMALRSLGAPAEAQALYQEAVAGCERTLGQDDSQTGVARVGLGRTLVDQGRFADAQTQLIEAERVLGSAPRASSARHSQCIEALMEMYEAWNLVEPDGGHQTSADAWRARRDGGP